MSTYTVKVLRDPTNPPLGKWDAEIREDGYRIKSIYLAVSRRSAERQARRYIRRLRDPAAHLLHVQGHVMIRAAEAPSPTQAVAWVGHLDDGSRLLVRLYTDGSVTAERRVVGAYMGELALTPEPVPA